MTDDKQLPPPLPDRVRQILLKAGFAGPDVFCAYIEEQGLCTADGGRTYQFAGALRQVMADEGAQVVDHLPKAGEQTWSQILAYLERFDFDWRAHLVPYPARVRGEPLRAWTVTGQGTMTIRAERLEVSQSGALVFTVRGRVVRALSAGQWTDVEPERRSPAKERTINMAEALRGRVIMVTRREPADPFAVYEAKGMADRLALQPLVGRVSWSDLSHQAVVDCLDEMGIHLRVIEEEEEDDAHHDDHRSAQLQG